MKKTFPLILFFCILGSGLSCFAQNSFGTTSSSNSKINPSFPDSLIQNLNSVNQKERLNIWQTFIEDFKASEASLYELAVLTACDEAKSILSADSAAIWCFEQKMSLKRSYRYSGDVKKALEILVREKDYVDSLAASNNGTHILQALWHSAAAHYYYMDSDTELTIKHMLKSKELYHKNGEFGKDFQIHSRLGATKSWAGRLEEALVDYTIADSIGRNNANIAQRSKIYLKYKIGLLHSQMDNREAANNYYQAALANSELLPKINLIRVKLDYYNNLCWMGKSVQALEGFNNLESQIDTTINTHLGTLYNSYANCLVRSGQFDKAMIYNDKFLSYRSDDFEKRQEEQIAEMQTKFEVRDKEAKIKELELETANAKTKFRLRVLFITLIAVGTLLFLLYRNRVNQKQIKAERNRDRQISQNRDRLFSSITHDIRTPLALMMAPLERIGNLTDDKNIQADVKLARRNGSRLMELFNQILDWNKAEAKALILNNQVGRMDLSLSTLCNRFYQLALENNINFKHSINVPNGQFSLDYDKIDKVLSNLISNSVKFCEAGQTIQLDIFYRENNNDSFLEINCKDNGPGISLKDQEKLFDRYYQGEHGKIKGGTGIGMALVKELVGLMKGSITLDSSPNKGVNFALTIPVKEVTDIMVSKPLDEKSLIENQKDEQILVLVVEDEPELLEFLNSVLTEDYKVVKAESANVGLAIASSRIPEIIISDWTLPDQTGGWLCKELSKNPLTSHIPVIVLTAHNIATYRELAFDAGAVAFMNKPFKIDILKKQINTILNQQKRMRLKWGAVGSEKASKEDKPPLDSFVQSVLECIENNLSDEYFGVEKMANLLHLNRVQLFRKLKNTIGKSPSQLIKEHRLNRSRELLRDTQKTVSEIAYEVGFSDPNYFSTAYKKHFNASPSDDRSLKS